MKTSMQEKESRQAGAAITRPGLCRARCAEHTRLSGIKAGLRMRHRRLCCLVLFGAEAGVLQNRCVALPPSLRLALQGRRLAPSTINLRLAAVRRLAYERADDAQPFPCKTRANRNLRPIYLITSRILIPLTRGNRFQKNRG